MAAAYSMDLRERVMADSDAGLSSKQLAERYHVSPAWVDALEAATPGDRNDRRAQTNEISRAGLAGARGSAPRVGHRATGCDPG
jgi:hypothetical protein